jgi:hypothetical protein
MQLPTVILQPLPTTPEEEPTPGDGLVGMDLNPIKQVEKQAHDHILITGMLVSDSVICVQ